MAALGPRAEQPERRVVDALELRDEVPTLPLAQDEPFVPLIRPSLRSSAGERLTPLQGVEHPVQARAELLRVRRCDNVRQVALGRL